MKKTFQNYSGETCGIIIIKFAIEIRLIKLNVSINFSSLKNKFH